MKIAILTSGILPVPATQGGAVENLIDFYLEYNDRHKLHDITVYSVTPTTPSSKKHVARKSDVNHYRYIDSYSWLAKIRKRLYLKLRGGEEPHHYSIEFFLEQAIKHLRKQDYDMVIMENRPAYSLKVGKVTDAKMVNHLHNEKLTVNSRHAKEIYDAASLIICVSDYIADCVRTISPDDRKCRTVHNGIALSAFSRQHAATIHRSDLGLAEDDFVLVFSGRLNQEKGIRELIEAMMLLKAHQNIKLLILGSSFYGHDQSDDPFTVSLKEKALSLQKQIIFTGFIPYEQIPDYLNLSDLAVIPSVWNDPFPTTVLEAQAAGLPVIATRRGGIPEEVSTDNAILLETGDRFVKDLAHAILDLYEHPEKRSAMSQASLQRSKQFDKDTYARNFFKALEEGVS